MKKVFLLFVLTTIAITTNSCSNDKDDIPETTYGTISMKVDGVQKTLNVYKVELIKNLEGTADEYTQIEISAFSKITGDRVTFSLKKGNLGNSIVGFTYLYNGDMGYLATSDFSNDVTANGDDKKLIGTFSDNSNAPYFSITEGSFNIQY